MSGGHHFAQDPIICSIFILFSTLAYDKITVERLKTHLAAVEKNCDNPAVLDLPKTTQ